MAEGRGARGGGVVWFMANLSAGAGAGSSVVARVAAADRAFREPPPLRLGDQPRADAGPAARGRRVDEEGIVRGEDGGRAGAGVSISMASAECNSRRFASRLILNGGLNDWRLRLEDRS